MSKLYEPSATELPTLISTGTRLEPIALVNEAGVERPTLNNPVT